MNIKQRFCPSCGKPSNDVCEQCQLKTKKKITLLRCENCNNTYYKNKKTTTKKFQNYEIQFKQFKCDKCARKSSYKALIQLRGGLEPDFDKLKEWDEWIKEVIRKKEGWDIKFTDKNKAYSYAKKIRKQYKTEFKITSKLVTQTKDGKKIYRPTFLLRLSTN